MALINFSAVLFFFQDEKIQFLILCSSCQFANPFNFVTFFFNKAAHLEIRMVFIGVDRLFRLCVFVCKKCRTPLCYFCYYKHATFKNYLYFLYLNLWIITSILEVKVLSVITLKGLCHQIWKALSGIVFKSLIWTWDANY